MVCDANHTRYYHPCQKLKVRTWQQAAVYVILRISGANSLRKETEASAK